MNFVATSLRAALRPLQQDLRVAKVTAARVKGHTIRTAAAPRGFRGVIAEADIWKQFMAPGGVISSTRPVLVVFDGLLDDEGEALEIGKDDLVDRGDDNWLKILDVANEVARYGVRYYTLVEAPKPAAVPAEEEDDG